MWIMWMSNENLQVKINEKYTNWIMCKKKIIKLTKKKTLTCINKLTMDEIITHEYGSDKIVLKTKKNEHVKIYA